MADVAADVDGVVTTNGARGGRKRVGGTENGTTSLDGITAFPDHGADGARGHVLNKTFEERLVLEISVVSLKVRLAGADELYGGELEAAALETRDDGTNEAALDAIGLDSNEGLLGRRHCGFRARI